MQSHAFEPTQPVGTPAHAHFTFPALSSFISGRGEKYSLCQQYFSIESFERPVTTAVRVLY